MIVTTGNWMLSPWLISINWEKSTPLMFTLCKYTHAPTVSTTILQEKQHVCLWDLLLCHLFWKKKRRGSTSFTLVEIKKNTSTITASRLFTTHPLCYSLTLQGSWFTEIWSLFFFANSWMRPHLSCLYLNRPSTSCLSGERCRNCNQSLTNTGNYCTLWERRRLQRGWCNEQSSRPDWCFIIKTTGRRRAGFTPNPAP